MKDSVIEVLENDIKLMYLGKLIWVGISIVSIILNVLLAYLLMA
jgi:hypothetical protein